MYITLETDYAIRIVDCLARKNQRMGAQAIADLSNVTLRFALKILRKLVGAGILRSYKGVQGGYELQKKPAEITLYDIMETIEGPYGFSRCVLPGHQCPRNLAKPCPYHLIFQDVTDAVVERLKKVTIEDTISSDGHSDLHCLSNFVFEKNIQIHP